MYNTILCTIQYNVQDNTMMVATPNLRAATMYNTMYNTIQCAIQYNVEDSTLMVATPNLRAAKRNLN